MKDLYTQDSAVRKAQRLMRKAKELRKKANTGKFLMDQIWCSVNAWQTEAGELEKEACEILDAIDDGILTPEERATRTLERGAGIYKRPTKLKSA